MVCPNCHSEKMSKVYWVHEDGNQVRRYRECTKCGQRYVTLESVLRKLGQPVKKG